MSARTPEQLAEDREASCLAQSLLNALLKLGIHPDVAVNALAGALGAYVAMSVPQGDAPRLMRLMARQAREQMEMQLRLIAIGKPVGNA